MPGFFVTAIVFVILGLLVWAGSYLAPRDDDHDVTARGITRVVAGIVGLLGLICLIMSSFDIVGTRNVGIVTQFGRPVAERPNGIAWHAPWQKVTDMDAAIQLQSFEGNTYDDPGNAVKVRLGNNSSAFVESNLNWRIREDAAGKMFQDYRTFENIRQNLVDRQLQVALSKHFATFNPQQQTQGADLPGIAALVKHDLQDAVGSEIEIIDVRVPGIFYDKDTQQRIDQFNQEAQNTRNAEQRVKTAEQERIAAEQRAAQAPPDLRIAVFNCLNSQVAAGRDPAGCWSNIGGTPLIQLPKP